MCGKELVWPDSRTYDRRAGDVRLKQRRATFRAAYQRRAERFEKANLTRHGTKPQGGHGRVTRTDLELAWRELRATMGEIKVPEPSSSSLRYEQ